VDADLHVAALEENLATSGDGAVEEHTRGKAQRRVARGCRGVGGAATTNVSDSQLPRSDERHAAAHDAEHDRRLRDAVHVGVRNCKNCCV
jgi:hypothetical protein